MSNPTEIEAELKALSACASAFDALTDAERCRALEWLVDRYVTSRLPEDPETRAAMANVRGSVHGSLAAAFVALRAVRRELP